MRALRTLKVGELPMRHVERSGFAGGPAGGSIAHSVQAFVESLARLAKAAPEAPHRALPTDGCCPPRENDGCCPPRENDEPSAERPISDVLLSLLGAPPAAPQAAVPRQAASWEAAEEADTEEAASGAHLTVEPGPGELVAREPAMITGLGWFVARASDETEAWPARRLGDATESARDGAPAPEIATGATASSFGAAARRDSLHGAPSATTENRDAGPSGSLATAHETQSEPRTRIEPRGADTAPARSAALPRPSDAHAVARSGREPRAEPRAPLAPWIGHFDPESTLSRGLCGEREGDEAPSHSAKGQSPSYRSANPTGQIHRAAVLGSPAAPPASAASPRPDRDVALVEPPEDHAAADAVRPPSPDRSPAMALVHDGTSPRRHALDGSPGPSPRRATQAFELPARAAALSANVAESSREDRGVAVHRTPPPEAMSTAPNATNAGPIALPAEPIAAGRPPDMSSLPAAAEVPSPHEPPSQSERWAARGQYLPPSSATGGPERVALSHPSLGELTLEIASRPSGHLSVHVQAPNLDAAVMLRSAEEELRRELRETGTDIGVYRVRTRVDAERAATKRTWQPAPLDDRRRI